MKKHIPHIVAAACGLLLMLPQVADAAMKYRLQVTIDPAKGELAGKGTLTPDVTGEVELYLKGLTDVTIGTTKVGKGGITAKTVGFAGKEIPVSFRLEGAKAAGLMQKDAVALTDVWYPLPSALAEYDVTVELPAGFQSIMEAETVVAVDTVKSATSRFIFPHPVDRVSLAASRDFVVKGKKTPYGTVEAWLSKKNADLADRYIALTEKSLKEYSDMLGKYPYTRFAVVESPLPVGYSMPTFTMIGSSIIRMPFIADRSLAHEVLHQWFGNYAYIDYNEGNWAEAVTNYLADHRASDLKGEGAIYRKETLLTYEAHVDNMTAYPLAQFHGRSSKRDSAIGYGKGAMLFHMIRTEIGDDAFFGALKTFIADNQYKRAGWSGLAKAFSRASGKDMSGFISPWVARKSVLNLTADAQFAVTRGVPTLTVTLTQEGDFYPGVTVPVTVNTESGEYTHRITMTEKSITKTIPMSQIPLLVRVDKDFDLMRKLDRWEKAPTIAALQGKKHLYVSYGKEEKLYSPLRSIIPADSHLSSDTGANLELFSDHSLVIAGRNNPLVKRLFDGWNPKAGHATIEVRENPFNYNEVVVLVDAPNQMMLSQLLRKLTHYGTSGSIVMAPDGSVTKEKSVSENGMLAFGRSSTKAVPVSVVPSFGDIMKKMTTRRVVLVGEQHDDYTHHLNQLEVIRYLKSRGVDIAIGMEMFQHPSQKALDDYIAGKTTEKEFLRASDYFNTWRFDYTLYKPILDYAKAEKIPVVALNIAGDINKKIGKTGLDSLTDKERESLPKGYNMGNPYYAHDLQQVHAMHAMIAPHDNSTKETPKIDPFLPFFEAQATWDEVMAETAAEYLKKHPEKRMVVLAGNGHIRKGYGIVNRLERRIGERVFSIVQGDELEQGMADYVLYSDPVAGQSAPKLGISLEERKEGGLAVLAVSDDSPAKKGGMQAGDLLVAAEGEAVKDLLDLKYLLMNRSLGDTLSVTVQRGKEDVKLSLTLISFGEKKSPHK